MYKNLKHNNFNLHNYKLETHQYEEWVGYPTNYYVAVLTCECDFVVHYQYNNKISFKEFIKNDLIDKWKDHLACQFGEIDVS